MDLSILARILASADIMFTICNPVILKALHGDIHVIECIKNFSEREAKGVYIYPENTSSQCISSDITVIPSRMHISPMNFNSSYVHTLPVGLWGLHCSIIFICSHAEDTGFRFHGYCIKN